VPEGAQPAHVVRVRAIRAHAAQELRAVRALAVHSCPFAVAADYSPAVASSAELHGVRAWKHGGSQCARVVPGEMVRALAAPAEGRHSHADPHCATTE
jgi:hypothetical protein